MGKLIRPLDNPELDNIKINSSDHFELVTMRHKYFRASTNPTPERLAKFEEMLCKISNKIYLRNMLIFKTVGFEFEDLRNLARVHTVSFISMSGLAENPKLMAKFREQHKKKYGQDSEPGVKDVFKREAYNLARFLNQRLQETALFSKRKNKNIRGTRPVRKFYIGSSSRNPTDFDLYIDPKTFGFKKITEAEFKRQVKENDAKGKAEFLNKKDELVRAIYLEGSILTSEDVDDTIMDQRTGTEFYRTPEETILLKEALAYNDEE